MFSNVPSPDSSSSSAIQCGKDLISDELFWTSQSEPEIARDELKLETNECPVYTIGSSNSLSATPASTIAEPVFLEEEPGYPTHCPLEILPE